MGAVHRLCTAFPQPGVHGCALPLEKAFAAVRREGHGAPVHGFFHAHAAATVGFLPVARFPRCLKAVACPVPCAKCAAQLVRFPSSTPLPAAAGAPYGTACVQMPHAWGKGQAGSRRWGNFPHPIHRPAVHAGAVCGGRLSRALRPVHTGVSPLMPLPTQAFPTTRGNLPAGLPPG